MSSKKLHHLKNNHVLFLTEIYPSGLTGTSVKARNTILALVECGYQVDVICVSYQGLEEVKLELPGLRIFSSQLGQENRTEILLKLLANFRFYPTHVNLMFNFFQKKMFKLLTESQKYSCVLVNEFSMLQYLSPVFKGKVVYLDDEDITGLLLKRAKFEKNFLLKIINFFDFCRSAFYEKKFLSLVNQIWAISSETKNHFSKLVKNSRISVMPTIVEKRKDCFKKKSSNLVFTGTLNWPENLNGLNWFLKDEWLKILTFFPHCKLFIVGQGADETMIKEYGKIPGVIYKGYVKDLKTVYRQCALGIAPIFLNSGIKVKILTYLSYGLPVVAISESVIGLSSNEGISIASEENFSQKVIELLKNDKKREKFSTAGQKNIALHHSLSNLTKFLQQKM